MRDRIQAGYIKTNDIACERESLKFWKCHCDRFRIRCLEFSSEGDGNFEEEEGGYGEIEMVSGEKLPYLKVWWWFLWSLYNYIVACDWIFYFMH